MHGDEKDPVYNDPDAENAEQAEAGSQAQDVAEDALKAKGIGESERGGRKDPARLVPDDVPDLVERMEQMKHSGRIDMDAFAGEADMDDEEGTLPQDDDEA